MRLARAVAAAVALTTACGAVACSKGGTTPHARAVVLDGRPRYPNDEGVLRAITGDSLTIDTRKYRITENLQSFSSSSREKVSPADRVSQYAQVGLDGKKAVWIALYSVVVKLGDHRAVSYHLGVLLRASKGRLFFADGSVLKVAATATIPKTLPTSVRADIDVERHRVERLTVLSV